MLAKVALLRLQRHPGRRGRLLERGSRHNSLLFPPTGTPRAPAPSILLLVVGLGLGNRAQLSTAPVLREREMNTGGHVCLIYSFCHLPGSSLPSCLVGGCLEGGSSSTECAVCWVRSRINTRSAAPFISLGEILLSGHSQLTQTSEMQHAMTRARLGI